MFASLPAAQKKRQRPSDGGRGATSGFISASLASPAAHAASSSQNSVPRASTSAASWGVAQLSDSEGDADLDEPAFAQPAYPHTALSSAVPAVEPPPSKRPHLDEQTSGRFASMRLDTHGLHRGPRPSPGAPPAAAAAADHHHPHRHQHHSTLSRRRGVGGIFGQANLPRGLSFDPISSTDGVHPPAYLAAPPSSPIKASAQLAPLPDAIVTAPPTSPEPLQRNQHHAAAPPVSPVHSLPPAAKERDAWLPPLTVETRDGDIEDMDMRIRRGPTSYEIEPDRIVVNSLDDTSSSEGEDGADDDDDDDDRTRAEHALLGGGVADEGQGQEGGAAGGFVVNKELMDKLEAHRRAVLTGTSDRDNEQSARDAKSASSLGGGGGRTRRGGRRAGGSLFGGLGSLLSSRRRSAQSSQASSPGYATPITNEEANGALVLWKDPEEVLRVAAASASAGCDGSETARANAGFPGNASVAPVPSLSSSSVPQTNGHGGGGGGGGGGFWSVPGATATATAPQQNHGGGMSFSFGEASSPLAAQQSSLSSSYFGQPRDGWQHLHSSTAEQQQQQQQQQHRPSMFPPMGQQAPPPPPPLPQPPFGLSEGRWPASRDAAHDADPSSHFGMADEMELDS